VIAKPHISLSISIVSYYSPTAQLTTTIRSLAAALRALNRHFQVEPLSVVLVDNSEFAKVRGHPQLINLRRSADDLSVLPQECSPVICWQSPEGIS
jgi:hypothetical protein